MNASLTLATFALVICLSAALPTGRRAIGDATSDETPQGLRFARKAGNLNVTLTPQQYLRDLYEEYELENLKTRQSTDKPTDIWCFSDKGELTHTN